MPDLRPAVADEHVSTREVVGEAPVDPLIGFFWARLDELETAALSAKGETHGRWNDGNDVPEQIVLYDKSGNITGGQVRHIALHGPKPVLDDVAAKKAIVDDYARYCADLDNPARELICQVTRDVIKRLATVHAGHPDYDEAWRP